MDSSNQPHRDMPSHSKRQLNMKLSVRSVWLRLVLTLFAALSALTIATVSADEQTEVCFYDEVDYVDLYHCRLDSLPFIWGNYQGRARSIRVPAGYTLTLFEYASYGGDSWSYTESIANLPWTQRNSRSLRIELTDEDLDGVLDLDDSCPGTVVGESVDAQGCSTNQLNADADGDGVSDYFDSCPDTPANQTVDDNGCSPDQIDSDFDGIADYQDPYPLQDTGTQCLANQG